MPTKQPEHRLKATRLERTAEFYWGASEDFSASRHGPLKRGCVSPVQPVGRLGAKFNTGLHFPVSKGSTALFFSLL